MKFEDIIFKIVELIKLLNELNFSGLIIMVKKILYGTCCMILYNIPYSLYIVDNVTYCS